MRDKLYLTGQDLGRYIQSVSVREPDILRRLREETSTYELAIMQIPPEQGQFLALLVNLLGAKRTIELGVFTGYSSLAVALALPPEGRIVACDVSEEYTAVARRYWNEAGVSEKIGLHLAPARETLERLLAEGQEGTFDFAFIDADKTGYEEYYELCLRLVRRGGLIAADNTLQHGDVIVPENQEAGVVAIRRFNEKLHEDARVALSLVPMADGLTLAMKR